MVCSSVFFFHLNIELWTLCFVFWAYHLLHHPIRRNKIEYHFVESFLTTNRNKPPVSNNSVCDSSTFSFDKRLHISDLISYFIRSTQSDDSYRCMCAWDLVSLWHLHLKFSYLPYSKSISLSSETFSVTMFCKLKENREEKDTQIITIENKTKI